MEVSDLWTSFDLSLIWFFFGLRKCGNYPTVGNGVLSLIGLPHVNVDWLLSLECHMMDMCLSISCPCYVVFSSCGNCSCYAKNVSENE